VFLQPTGGGHFDDTFVARAKSITYSDLSGQWMADCVVRRVDSPGDGWSLHLSVNALWVW
jgi:hypothetical protein